MKCIDIDVIVESSIFNLVQSNIDKSDEEVVELIKKDMIDKLLKSNICSEFSTKLEQKQDVDELHTILRFGYRRKWLPLFNHVQLYNLTLIREAYKAINELV